MSDCVSAEADPVANRAPMIRLRIDLSEECALGPGKIGLLESIDETGSLSAAARALGMSYRRAWLLLHSLNDGFGQSCVELKSGGRDGGGAEVTEFGRKLVRTYRECEARVAAYAKDAFAGIALRPVTGGKQAGTKAAPVQRRPVSRTRKTPGKASS